MNQISDSEIEDKIIEIQRTNLNETERGKSYRIYRRTK